MPKRKLLYYAVITVFMIMLPAGCVSPLALPDRIIVEAIGIDYNFDSDMYEVSLQYFHNSGSGGQNHLDSSKSNTLVVHGKGGSVFEAMYQASITQGKEAFLGVNKLIVLGKDAATQNVSETLRYFITDIETNPNLLVCATDGTAKDIMDVKYADGVVSSSSVVSIVRNARSRGYSVETNLIETYASLGNSLQSTIMPVINISVEEDRRVEASENPAPESDGEGAAGGSETVYNGIVVDGAALFKENVYVGKLSEEENKGVSWFRNNCTNTEVFIKLNDKDTASVLITEGTAKIRPYIVDGNLLFSVKYDLHGKIEESTFVINREMSEDYIDVLQDLAETQIEETLTASLLKTVNDFGVDVMGLENIFRKYGYEEWYKAQEYYDEMFTTAAFEVDVNIDIYRYGIQNYE